MPQVIAPDRPARAPEANPYLSGNFAPVSQETTAFDPRVRGTLPEDLDGRLARIGPNPAGPVDPASYHWFTGPGMVHGLRLRGGRAEWYRNRFVLDDAVAAAIGRPPIPGPGHGSPNTHVTRIGGRAYALVEAGGAPVEIDGEMESVARSDFGGSLPGGFTAHPKRDPLTGEMLAMTYQPGMPFLRCLSVDAEGRARTLAEIPAPHGPMVHDVGFTKQFVVVLDLPVTFQPMAEPGSPFPYFWDEAHQPRVGLLPRTGDLSGLKWFEAPSCYVFHILNAYEAANGTVVVDVVRHRRMFDRDRRGPGEGKSVLARWTLDLSRGTLAETLLDDRGCEFPRFDDRRGGQDYRYGYSTGLGEGFTVGPLLKHDVQAARTLVHDPGPGRFAMEPVFVPRAGGTGEDDGYILAYVHDADRNAGEVIVLSAQDFAGPPLAVVELPVRVPFGFHGDWLPEAG